MENKMTAQTGEFAVGDRVLLVDKKFSGEAEQVAATVLEIREILGKQTYVIETEKGSRKVVGASQISRASA